MSSILINYLSIHLIIGQVVTLVHAVGVGSRADVVRHQVLLLQLVVEVRNTRNKKCYQYYQKYKTSYSLNPSLPSSFL